MLSQYSGSFFEWFDLERSAFAEWVWFVVDNTRRDSELVACCVHAPDF